MVRTPLLKMIFILSPLLLIALTLLWLGQDQLEETYDTHHENQWPVDRIYGQDHISSPFGYRYDPFTGVWVFHSGIDIALDEGEPVYAIREGRVHLASTHYPGFGSLLIIEHEDRDGDVIRSIYGHCHEIFVKEGQDVKGGERIATVGSRGRSTGPHLHLEVHYYLGEEEGWVVVDPLEYIEPPES